MQSNKIDFIKLINFSPVISIVGFLLAIGLFIWLSPRGLDFTDEGWYLLAARYPQDMTAIYSMWYIYTAIFFKLVDYNIVALRCINLSFEILSLFICVYGLEKLWSVILGRSLSPFEKITYISFVSMGGLLGFVILGFTPGYNTVNSQAAYMVVGFISYALARLLQNKFNAITKFFFVLAGLGLGLSLFSKFSSAICLFCLLVLAIILAPGFKIKDKIACFLPLLIGFCVWLLMHFTLLQKPSDFLHIFTDGIALDANSKIHNLSQLPSDFNELGQLFYKAFYNFRNVFFLLAALAVWTYFQRQSKALAYIMRYLPAILLIFALILAARRAYYVGGYSNYINETILYLDWLLYMGATIVLGIYYYKFNIHCKVPRYYLFLFVLGLLIFPFIEPFGAGNTTYFNSVFYSAVWFVLIYEFSRVLGIIFNNKWFNSVNIAFITILAIIQIVTSYIDPYRTTDLYKQNQIANVGQPETQLKLNFQTANAIIQLQQAAKNCDFQAGGIILDFYNNPGLIYALGGVMPVTGWNLSGTAKSQYSAEAVMSRLSRQQLDKAFILQDVLINTDLPNFTQFGINFPKHYKLCGQVGMENMLGPHLFRLWKPL